MKVLDTKMGLIEGLMSVTQSSVILPNPCGFQGSPYKACHELQ